MTEADWLWLIGQWALCWTTGFAAGFIYRWTQGLSEKL